MASRSRLRRLISTPSLAAAAESGLSNPAPPSVADAEADADAEPIPADDGGDYDLAGFMWHQGWNDGGSWDHVNEYEDNLVSSP